MRENESEAGRQTNRQSHVEEESWRGEDKGERERKRDELLHFITVIRKNDRQTERRTDRQPEGHTILRKRVIFKTERK